MKNKIENILFVCTGNSCRSVMAEGLLKKMLKEQERHDITISSAGTAAIDGFNPADNAIAVMKKEGVDVSDYKTSLLDSNTIKKADLILVMQRIHKDMVLNLVPEAKEKTHLLKEYVKLKGDSRDTSVPDPIGRPLEVYERVLDMLKIHIEELVKML